MCLNNSLLSFQKKPKQVKDDTPLPDPFPLPMNFRRDIDEALAARKLSKKQTQYFITQIAYAMLRFKNCPTCEVICVARSVIMKYPFFKPSIGRPYVI